MGHHFTEQEHIHCFWSPLYSDHTSVSDLSLVRRGFCSIAYLFHHKQLIVELDSLSCGHGPGPVLTGSSTRAHKVHSDSETSVHLRNSGPKRYLRPRVKTWTLCLGFWVLYFIPLFMWNNVHQKSFQEMRKVGYAGESAVENCSMEWISQKVSVANMSCVLSGSGVTFHDFMYYINHGA